MAHIIFYLNESEYFEYPMKFNEIYKTGMDLFKISKTNDCYYFV